MSLHAVSRVKGSPCPGCGHGDGGIEFQAGLHQDPIVQCIHCAARIFVGVDSYRAVIPEDKAPPVRRDFLMARAFDDGLDGLNRQIADFEGIVREHETKAAYWRRRVAVVRAEREELLGVKRPETGESKWTVPVHSAPVQSAKEQVSEPGAQA